MNDFFAFRRMITPIFIQIGYWVLIVGIAVLGVATGLFDSPLLAIPIAIFGFLVIRVVAEVLILGFRVSETTTDIRNATIGQTGTSASIVDRTSLTIADFLTFRRMIMPVIIRVVFVILIMLVIVGIGLVLLDWYIDTQRSRWTPSPFQYIPLIFAGVITLPIVRIITELFMVIFVVNENLTDIRNTESKRAAGTASVAGSGVQLVIKDFLAFRRMVAPIFIQIAYWFLIVFVILLAFNFNLFLTGDMNLVLRLLLTVAFLIPLLLIVRLFTEMSLVPFRINGTLTDIRTLIVRQEGGPAANETSSISDFLTFRRMIAPILIQVLYWILTIGIIMETIRAIIRVIIVITPFELPELLWEISFGRLHRSANELAFNLYEIGIESPYNLMIDFPVFVPGLLLGVLVYLLLVMRIYAEQLLLVFRVNESLTDIRNAKVRQTGDVNHRNLEATIVDFLMFRRMITPVLIQAFYWLLTVGVVILVWWAQDSGFLEDIPGGIPVVGLLLIAGLLAVRIFIEVSLILFRINGTLTDIGSATMLQAGSTRTESTPQTDTASAETPMKTCPYCAESIPYEETTCRYCRSEVPNEPESSGL